MNSQTLRDIENADDLQMKEILLAIAKWFKKNGLANPFNYNFGFEFIQCLTLGYKKTTKDKTLVGGGSDGISLTDPNITAEFKATEYKGQTKNGVDKSHSFSYNGTSRFDTIKEQEDYCYNKIMRDPYHYWTIFDYNLGSLYKTFKVKNSDVWSLIWTKWERSWYNTNNKDPRIGGSISTNEMKKSNIQPEVINH